jgi:cell division protein ZipA
MDKLRLTLLIVGCFIVLGIYLWEIFYKTSSKKQSVILDDIDGISDISLPPLNNEADYHSEAMTGLDRILNQSKHQAIVQNTSLEPRITQKKSNDEDDISEKSPLTHTMDFKDYGTVLTENNNHDVFAEIEENIQENENEITSTELDYGESILEVSKNSEDILLLYITSPAHISFNGLTISKAADEIGMVYGHMNIFHHFGLGKLHSGQPLFSAANMHEPGSFDLGRMADLNTKGIVMFMYSPVSIDAHVIFELYLNTTQRMAKILGGDMRTSDNKILNTISINTLRDKAGSF